MLGRSENDIKNMSARYKNALSVYGNLDATPEEFLEASQVKVAYEDRRASILGQRNSAEELERNVERLRTMVNFQFPSEAPREEVLASFLADLLPLERSLLTSVNKILVGRGVRVELVSTQRSERTKDPTHD